MKMAFGPFLQVSGLMSGFLYQELLEDKLGSVLVGEVAGERAQVLEIEELVGEGNGVGFDVDDLTAVDKVLDEGWGGEVEGRGG
jgi:hypothetical protein